jgi:hypothetical protein
MPFTVRQLVDALEEAPEDAVVMIEYGNYVKAADSIALIDIPDGIQILAIQARDAEAVDKKDIH